MRLPYRAPELALLLLLGSALATGCAGGGAGSPELTHADALFAGEAALAEGNFEVAARAFRAALRAVPHEARALRGLARSHLERGDAEAALRVLQELEQHHPEYTRLHAEEDRCRALEAVARGRLALGDSQQALSMARALSRAACQPEENTRLLWQSLVAEARRERDARRTDEAIALFRAATEVDATRPEPFAEAAALLLAAKRRDEALEWLSSALIRHPDDRVLLDLMVQALLEPDHVPEDARGRNPRLREPAGTSTIAPPQNAESASYRNLGREALDVRPRC